MKFKEVKDFGDLQPISLEFNTKSHLSNGIL